MSSEEWPSREAEFSVGRPCRKSYVTPIENQCSVRSAKVIAERVRAGFLLVTHRVDRRPSTQAMGDRIELSIADLSLEKWPRVRMARRRRAFIDDGVLPSHWANGEAGAIRAGWGTAT